MPVLTAPAVQTTLAQVREAIRLVRADAVAQLLADQTGPEPDPEGALGQWLYAAWWCGVDGPLQPPTKAAPTAYAVLEAARRRTATADPGWLVLAVTDEAVVAANLHTRERATVRSDAVLESSRPGRSPRPGDLVTVLNGASGVDETRAWWWASTTHQPLPTGPTTRWYVHPATLDAALAAVPLLLGLLGELGIPASLKCPPVAELYGRRDALVVYLPRERAEQAEQALVEAGAVELAGLLASDIPPLTRRMVPGIGVADDPGDGLSYGQLRCAQLAVVAADPDPDTTDAALVARLARLGIAADRPEVLSAPVSRAGTEVDR